MLPRFIDTHAHLNDESYNPEGGPSEVDDVIARAAAAGVGMIFHPDIDKHERESARSICRAHPGVVLPMAGLYPGSVDGNWKKDVEETFAGITPDIIAIGEIGLDYHWSTEFKEEQKEALRCQLELALELELPLNIHVRDATDDFFTVLEGFKGRGLRGNVHAFSGSIDTYRRLQKYGDWKVGIGGVVTFKNAKVALSVKEIPLQDILLETDSPYLSPTPFRGQRNEPAMIPLIAEKIAQIKGIDIEEVARVTTQSALELFGIKP